MKRKIAICISGRPRYLEEGFQEINRYILSKYDCDVFIHTWWSSDMSNQAEQFSPKISYNRSYIYPENTIDIIKNLYKPIKISYEPSKVFNPYQDVNYEPLVPGAPESMYYSIMKSNDLKINHENELGFEYDLFIRTRFDLYFKPSVKDGGNNFQWSPNHSQNVPIFNFDLNTIDKSKIYMASYGNDQFAIGNSKNMNYYANLFNYIDTYYQEEFKEFMSEKLLIHHLSKRLDIEICPPLHEYENIPEYSLSLLGENIIIL